MHAVGQAQPAQGEVMRVRIGTSGWVYQHWRGIFYPDHLRQSNCFAYYAQVFDTVEITNSFYRLPSVAAFTAWRQQAPPDFVYAVKASRFLTHMKKLRDPGQPLERFFERVRLHGDAAHAGDYQETALEAWAGRLSEWRRQRLDVFVYFNNDIGGHALEDARTLRKMLDAA